MKTALALVGVGFVLAVGSIAAWYASTTQEAEANLQEAVDRSARQTPVRVSFVVTAPASTPDDQPLYVAGSAPALGNWDAAGLPLVRGEDGLHRADAELLAAVTYEFKITRGTWGTVERGPEGQDLPNRQLLLDADDTQVPVVVASWIDRGRTIPGRITISGELRLHKKLPSMILGNERDVAVWLPPGYDDDEAARYPVLYMHDGQNLFNAAAAYAGVEWGVDEAMSRLIAAGDVPPTIVVGIYNTPARDAEFTPSRRGNEYARFIVEELKPWIDARYRTLTDRRHTAIAGSGLGGLITLHIAHEHAQTFGRAAALSPWLRDNDRPLSLQWTDGAPLADTRLWLDVAVGGGENFPVITQLDDAQSLAARLSAAHDRAVDRFGALRYHEWPDGAQDETGWSKQIGPVLTWLLAD